MTMNGVILSMRCRSEYPCSTWSDITAVVVSFPDPELIPVKIMKVTAVKVCWSLMRSEQKNIANQDFGKTLHE